MCTHERKRGDRAKGKKNTTGGCDVQKSMLFPRIVKMVPDQLAVSAVQYVLCARTVGRRVDQRQPSLNLTLLWNLAFGRPMAQRSLLLQAHMHLPTHLTQADAHTARAGVLCSITSPPITGRLQVRSWRRPRLSLHLQESYPRCVSLPHEPERENHL